VEGRTEGMKKWREREREGTWEKTTAPPPPSLLLDGLLEEESQLNFSTTMFVAMC